MRAGRVMVGVGLAVGAMTLVACSDARPGSAPRSSTSHTESQSSTSTVPPTETTQDHCVFDYGAQLALLDPATGSTRWRVEMPWGVQPATWVDGDVAISYRPQGLTAVALADGSTRWEFPIEQPLGWTFGHQPGLVVLPTGGELMALDASTGDVRWKVAIDGERVQVASQEGAAGNSVFLNENGVITARSTKDGAVQWTDPTIGDFGYPPIVNGAELLHTAFEGAVYSVDATTGANRWKWTTRPGVGVWQAQPAGPDTVVAVTTAYLGNPDGIDPPTDSGQIVALDRATGRVRWSTPVSDGFSATPPIVMDGIVIYDDVLPDSGVVVRTGIDLAAGSVQWTDLPGPESELVARGGQLFASPYDPPTDPLVRLDPATGTTLLDTRLNDRLRALVVRDGVTWLGLATSEDLSSETVDDADTGLVAMMDPSTGTLSKAVHFRDAVQSVLPAADGLLVTTADDPIFCD